MKLYINTKVLWGLVGSIFFIIGLGILSYQYFLSLTAATQWSNHAREVVQNIDEIRSVIVNIENHQRGYLLTAEERSVRSIDISAGKLETLLTDLANITRDNPTQQANIDEVRPLITTYINSTKNILTIRKESFDKALGESKLFDNTGIKNKIDDILDRTRQEEQSLILSRSLSVQTGFYRFVYAFLGLIIVSCGVLIGLVWLINNNSKSRSIAEQKLRDAEMETKKINDDLESFTYSVSHDLRAPLRSINGYSQILIDDYSDKLDEEGNRVLSVVISNAKRMGRLIDDLLEFSRLGRKEITRGMVDVNEQVTIISTELLDLEKNRKIDLKIHPLGTASIDAVMMRQVWINLIGNALKYSRNKETTIIEIGRKDENGKAIFYVKDNGAGFDMAYMDKLFGVFQRLHKVNEFEGTGVGLALVKRIVEKHKGSVWAEAKVGEGATFYISVSVD